MNYTLYKPIFLKTVEHGQISLFVGLISITLQFGWTNLFFLLNMFLLNYLLYISIAVQRVNQWLNDVFRPCASFKISPCNR